MLQLYMYMCVYDYEEGLVLQLYILDQVHSIAFVECAS